LFQILVDALPHRETVELRIQAKEASSILDFAIDKDSTCISITEAKGQVNNMS
jgi:hypothetical protein